MTNATPAAAGWYRDPAGVERWWDGASWGVPRKLANEIVVRPSPPDGAMPAVYPHQHPQHFAGPSSPAYQQPMPVPNMVVAVPLKESSTAYLLAIFLGGFGAHRFYLERPGSAIAMLLLWQIGVWTAWTGVGALLAIAAGIWWIVDLCTMSGLVQDTNRRRLSMYGQQRY